MQLLNIAKYYRQICFEQIYWLVLSCKFYEAPVA